MIQLNTSDSNMTSLRPYSSQKILFKIYFHICANIQARKKRKEKKQKNSQSQIIYINS